MGTDRAGFRREGRAAKFAKLRCVAKTEICA